MSGFFFVLTFAFLLAQLPSEYQDLSGGFEAGEIRRACADLPAPAAALDHVPDDELVRVPGIGPDQNRNMLVFLLLRFQIQLALFSWMLFAFFVVFGSITIRPAVIETWFGRRPTYPARVFGLPIPGVSSELLHVALLLAALSTFYFTVSALTDDSFRRSFLAGTIGELRGAVAVRCGYLSLLARVGAAAQGGARPSSTAAAAARGPCAAAPTSPRRAGRRRCARARRPAQCAAA